MVGFRGLGGGDFVALLDSRMAPFTVLLTLSFNSKLKRSSHAITLSWGLGQPAHVAHISGVRHIGYQPSVCSAAQLWCVLIKSVI